jgi:hypothetical protein
MNKFFDLRFVIGAFFFLVGLMLSIYSFTNPTIQHAAVNRGCGFTFLVFAIVMMLLAISKRPKDKF